MKLCKALFVALVLTAVSGIPPAWADEGPGTITLESTEPVSTTEVRYVVRLTFTGDGHPARAATVTATAVDAEGVGQTPVAMAVADQDGRYEAIVTFPDPGEWTVRFTSVVPPGTLDEPHTIAAPSTTTTSEAVTTTTVPASTERADGEAASDEDGGDGFPWVVAIVGLVAVAAAGAGLVAHRGRTRADD